MAAPEADPRVVLGRIGAPYGVHGWMWVRSYSDPISNILGYPVWDMGRGGDWRLYKLYSGRVHGRGLIVQIGLEDGDGPVAGREAAARLSGMEIAVRRSQFAPPAPDEYYWVDLIGVRVLTVEGVDLGTVVRVFDTGANDVLVIRGERERLVPFLRDQVVREVDMDAGVMRVDWDPDF